MSAAVELIQSTQRELSKSGLHLHKIASNSKELLSCFPQGDLARNLQDICFDNLPMQRSLGVSWNLNSDSFCFKVNMENRSLTKRGILSVVNSIFDPLGFLAPVVLEGRLILRELMSTQIGWDEPVPPKIGEKWVSWRHEMEDLASICIPRCYFKGSLSHMNRVELHVFSDASVKAISAVVYILGFSVEVKHLGFVAGKSKVAPERGHTIPRLELCAAVLAAELYQAVSEHLKVKIDETKFYTDSRVVLGYICNQSKRFYTYVSNRVQKTVHACSPCQWNYVPSGQNPADIGSRGASVVELVESAWLSGPKFLLQNLMSVLNPFPLVEPENDWEICKEVTVKVTNLEHQTGSFCEILKTFSSWQRLVRALCTVRHILMSYHQRLPCKGWHRCSQSRELDLQEDTKVLVFREVQHHMYAKEKECLIKGVEFNKDSTIISLNPVLDGNGLLRVGGRLNRSSLSSDEKNPIILPGKHHISRLLVQHYHESVHHQGRMFTEGGVRSAGLWITGGKRLVSSVIHKCVICRKLRGHFGCQKMSDLPVDRVEQTYPFSCVGVDVFGPWYVVSRRIRGGQASSK